MTASNAKAVTVVVPETAISSPQYAPVRDSSVAAPSMACNADGCLAAWRDGRQGLGYRVWARRLRADGTPRDPAAFLVSVDLFDATDPVVATDGTRFLVAWSDLFSTMYLTRVDADDSLHSESADVASYFHDPVRPVALAFNGDGYLVVFAYPVATPGGTLKALRADRDGHILDATPILISDHPSARGIADVIWTGTQYLVVWNQGQGDGGDAYAARVRADGTVMDASGFFVANLRGFSNTPRLALGGGKVLLAAGRNAGSSGGGVTAFLLDTDGRNARAVPLPIVLSPNSESMTAVAAWNGSAFVVAWMDGTLGRPVAARIAPDGTSIDSAQIVLANPTMSQTPAIGVVGSTVFIVYVDMSYKAPPVRLVSLSAAGVVGHASTPPLDISSAPQRLLATARGANQTLVVWADDAQGVYASALLAARVSDDGAVLDATPIVLSVAAPDKQRASAAAAWAGGQYLVSWWERNALTTDAFQVARISAAGELRDSTPTVLAQNLFFDQVTTVVPSGDNFLVVWSVKGIISTPPPINAVPIGADGKPMGPSFRIGPTEASYPWAVAAAEGGGFLAAWNGYSGATNGVSLESIDAAGVQGTPVFVSRTQGSGSLDLVPSPGRTLLWLNGRAGMFLSPAPPFTSLSGSTPFDVKRNIGVPSWNGAAYVGASVTAPGIYDFDSAGVDVSVLSTDGVLTDSPTTIVAPRQLTTLAPKVIGLAPDKNLVVYSRLVPEHDQGALRLRFQIVDSARPSSPDGGQAADGGPANDGSTTGDGSTTSDGGLDAVDGAVARDAPDDDLRDAQDAATESARPDSAVTEVAADSSSDTSGPDLIARPDASADTGATPDAVVDASDLDAKPSDAAAADDAAAPRDAAADAAAGSSSGCSCAVSPNARARSGGEGAFAVLLLAVVACVRRRDRRRGR